MCILSSFGCLEVPGQRLQFHRWVNWIDLVVNVTQFCCSFICTTLPWSHFFVFTLGEANSKYQLVTGVETKPGWKIVSFWLLFLIWFTNAFDKIARKMAKQQGKRSYFIYAPLLSSCGLCYVTVLHLKFEVVICEFICTCRPHFSFYTFKTLICFWMSLIVLSLDCEQTTSN